MTKQEIIKKLIRLYKDSRYWIDFIKNTLDMSDRCTKQQLENRYNICLELYEKRKKETYSE